MDSTLLKNQAPQLRHASDEHKTKNIQAIEKRETQNHRIQMKGDSRTQTQRILKQNTVEIY